MSVYIPLTADGLQLSLINGDNITWEMCIIVIIVVMKMMTEGRGRGGGLKNRRYTVNVIN